MDIFSVSGTLFATRLSRQRTSALRFLKDYAGTAVAQHDGQLKFQIKPRDFPHFK